MRDSIPTSKMRPAARISLATKIPVFARSHARTPDVVPVLLSYCVFDTALQVFMPYYVLYCTSLHLRRNYVFVMARASSIAAVFTLITAERVTVKGPEVHHRSAGAVHVVGCRC
jgi:hypothetical protein